MITEIVNSYHQTAVPVCIRLCCRSAEAKEEKKAQFADTFLERSAPGSIRCAYESTREAEAETTHHRGLSAIKRKKRKKKCWWNKRRQPQIYAAGKEEDRFITSLAFCAVVIHRSITHLTWESLLSLSFSLCFICVPARLPAGLYSGSLGNATDWFLLPRTGGWLPPEKKNNQSHQSATARSPHRPQPARNPPLLPSPSPWAPGTVPCSTAETNIRIVMPLSVTHLRERKTPAHREQKWKTKRGRQRKFLHFYVISAPNFKLQQTVTPLSCR